MIKVIIELHPFGSEERKKVIGEMKIWNDASGSHEIGNYRWAWWRRSKDTRSRKCKEHTGFLRDFPRLRENVFELLRRCLNAPEEKIFCELGHPIEYFDKQCHKTHIISEKRALAETILNKPYTTPFEEDQ